MDFRKANPTFVDFVPETAAEAIDLFYRFKRLGVPHEQYPETFIWCSRKLNDEEGAKFEEFICSPQGVNSNVPVYEEPAALKAEREQLAREADARDARDAVIEEEDEGLPTMLPLTRQASGQVPFVEDDDEKVVEMVTPSPR